MDLTEFLAARLDEDEEQAKDHTCISCGNRTLPLRNVFGITGYTHDSWDPQTETPSGWEGRRCPGRVTGAEPVQNPDRRLREVEANRAVGEAHNRPEHYCPLPVLPGRTGQLWTPEEGPCWTLRLLAAVYSDHPDYRQEWKP